MATDDERMRIARRAYERARLRNAAAHASPAWVIVALAWLIDRDTMLALSAGSLLHVAATFLFFRGQHLGRAVLPGIAAGAIPFIAMHVAHATGHACNGAMCLNACLPATFVGAAVAGFVVSQRAKQSRAPVSSWAAGGVVAALTGALGCACVGIGGVIGLVAGLLVGSAPIVLRPRTAGGAS